MKIETEADEDESEGSDSECGETGDLSKITEMRLVPSDPSQCMFQTLKSCVHLVFHVPIHIFLVYCCLLNCVGGIRFFISFLAVDILFEIFCECAELNPELIEGEYYFDGRESTANVN